jgi:hypothetical protein
MVNRSQMRTTQSSIPSQIMRFYKTLMFELPTALVMDLGNADMKRVRQTAWTLYDSWIRLANDSSNALHADPSFGRLSGGLFETALLIQRTSTTIWSAILANLWPALELPTAQEVQRLRDNLAGLQAELQAARRAVLTHGVDRSIANRAVQTDNDVSPAPQAATSERLEGIPLCNQEINSSR